MSVCFEIKPQTNYLYLYLNINILVLVSLTLIKTTFFGSGYIVQLKIFQQNKLNYIIYIYILLLKSLKTKRLMIFKLERTKKV